MIAWLLLFPAAWASVGLMEETFSTTVADPATTAVWNLDQNRLQVPFIVDRSAGAVPGQEDEAIPLGDGSDGPFNADTLASFDLNSGATPGVVTLDSSRVYEFTTFTLPAGTTLRAEGTEPLRIRVQGDAQVDGTVDLRGGNGGDSQAAIPGTANGGTTCCTGGAGGNGANGTTPAGQTVGESPATGGGGTAGGVASAAADEGGGGGGGANLFDGQNGSAGDAGAGVKGALYGDETLVTLIGGAGGGGGGGSTDATTTGGGGGAGGGAFSLTVGGNFLNSATGQILVTGGTGGQALGGHFSGGGGGGAGGAVLIYAGGTGVNHGAIDAQLGAGGAGAVTGGDGSDGIIRFAFVGGDFTGTGSESPRPTTFPTTAYSQQPYQAVSPVYDTQSESPRYLELQRTETLQSGDSADYEVAGSSDGFTADDTGFLPESRLSEINGKRYFRWRVTLQSASAGTTPEVTRVAMHFVPDFRYSILGCARVPPSTSSSPLNPLYLLIYCTALIVFRRKLRLG